MSPRGLSWVTHPPTQCPQASTLLASIFPSRKQGLNFSNPSQAYNSLLNLFSHPISGCPHLCLLSIWRDSYEPGSGCLPLPASIPEGVSSPQDPALSLPWMEGSSAWLPYVTLHPKRTSKIKYFTPLQTQVS